MSKIHGQSAAAFLSVSVAAIVFAPTVQAKTPVKTYTVIHDFAGPNGDGAQPYSVVTFDEAGNLYGVTYRGGASNHGAIFKITPDGTETLIHSFDGASGGGNPEGGVVIDPITGDLYGATEAGGNVGGVCSSVGCGTLWKLATNGTFTILHAFGGPPNDGRYPRWQLIRDKKGNLYGVTAAGGTLDTGILFKYGKDGSFTTLYTFDTTTAQPVGRLARDRDGNIYGALPTGGSSHACSGHGCGALYRLSPDGAFVVLYSFTNNEDGRYPAAGVTLDKNGYLFGTNQAGGAGGYGVVYRLIPDGAFSTLFSFNGTNGTSPASEVLILRDDLYVTGTGGGANSKGTVVKVAQMGGGTVLHDFNGTDGWLPVAGLTSGERLLYGTAIQGGASDHGVVFSLPKK